MLAKIYSGAVVGMDTQTVEVEVDIAARGLPGFTIVGLPDKAIEESKERVRSALKNSGAEYPTQRITVNLAPADLPKNGPAYDMPIAVAILIASGQLAPVTGKYMFLGELSLDGSVRHTNGILPLTLWARQNNFEAVFIPETNSREAAIVSGVNVFPVKSILELYNHFRNHKLIQSCKNYIFSAQRPDDVRGEDFDFAEIRGQEYAKRAMEIAAAGGHNLFMQGPPGAGKTMLARSLPTILPDLTESEAIEVTKIYSITGNLPHISSVVDIRPFRAPHHTISRIGLIGGGSNPLPGEISLAHRGVLFLDEFPEFPRNVLESLRQPVEDGIVQISRAKGTVCYPAKFILIAAANPCPCGNFGSDNKICTCMPGIISRYQKRISGPIMDRIDIHIHVPAVNLGTLTERSYNIVESSKVIRNRVQKARDIQTLRYINTKYTCNADLNVKAIKDYCVIDHESTELLRKIADSQNLSARGYYKILKLARTIADLSGDLAIDSLHLAEAVQYRMVNT